MTTAGHVTLMSPQVFSRLRVSSAAYKISNGHLTQRVMSPSKRDPRHPLNQSRSRNPRNDDCEHADVRVHSPLTDYVTTRALLIG